MGTGQSLEGRRGVGGVMVKVPVLRTRMGTGQSLEMGAAG